MERGATCRAENAHRRLEDQEFRSYLARVLGYNAGQLASPTMHTGGQKIRSLRRYSSSEYKKLLIS
jgi:hypothetical protein